MPIDITSQPDPASFELLRRFSDRLLFEQLCAVALGPGSGETELGGADSCAADAECTEEYQQIADSIDSEPDEFDLLIMAFRRAWQGESLGIVVEGLGVEPRAAQVVEAALVACRIRRASVRVARVRVDGDAEAVAAAEAELATAEADLAAVLPVLRRLAI